MEFFANLIITIAFIAVSLFIVVLVHEIGHYIVARCIIKEQNAKINMGFFGKPIINTKRFRINALFFAGGYVGGFSKDGEAKRSHMIIFFAAGGFFVFLLGTPVTLYLTGGIGLGNSLRSDLFSVPVENIGFPYSSWLSLATPLDFFNMFMLYISNLIPIFILIAFVPYFYPFKGYGKWHLNPSDGMWVLKYIFNKVSEKDTANAVSAINENTDEMTRK